MFGISMAGAFPVETAPTFTAIPQEQVRLLIAALLVNAAATGFV
jgi:hypothetical protein